MKKEFNKRVFISPGVYTREPFNHQDYIRMVNKKLENQTENQVSRKYMSKPNKYSNDDLYKIIRNFERMKKIKKIYEMD